MNTEEVQALIDAAKGQSEINTVLLSVIAILMFAIGWGLRWAAAKIFSDFETALNELREIKLDVARHEEAIETLKHR